jgi:hypothetical protein
MEQKSKQAEIEQKRRQVLLTVSKVMLDMVALGLEHVVVFVFDLPARLSLLVGVPSTSYSLPLGSGWIPGS